MPTRDERRAAERIERRSRHTGHWAPWERRSPDEHGVRQRSGWVSEVTAVYTNGLYAVLARPTTGGVTHLAIRTPTNLEPPWRDLQRIKDELFGPEHIAVQVCPPRSRLVDEADMYHLWVYPEGAALGFGLHALDEERRRAGA